MIPKQNSPPSSHPFFRFFSSFPGYGILSGVCNVLASRSPTLFRFMPMRVIGWFGVAWREISGALSLSFSRLGIGALGRDVHAVRGSPCVFP